MSLTMEFVSLFIYLHTTRNRIPGVVGLYDCTLSVLIVHTTDLLSLMYACRYVTDIAYLCAQSQDFGKSQSV